MRLVAVVLAVVLVLLVYYASLRVLLGVRGSGLRGREWVVWLVAMLVFAAAVLVFIRGVAGRAPP